MQDNPQLNIAEIQQKKPIKKIFLLSFIISLVVSGFIAIFVFLFGDFGDTELKLLFTTLAIGGYSLTGLGSATLYDRKIYIPFTITGIIVSIIGFLLTIGLIWFGDIWNNDFYWKIVLAFIVIAFSIAHISLLLLVKSEKKYANISLLATVIFISALALMLIYLIFDFGWPEEFYFRVLGVLAVLDVLGTIITPILKKID